ncbi:hypothetical protein [Paenibacillus sp. y28]|uniref:hypothetical protein n=1 Tax=Paenibacillus sp. y28 TaxID=3129110 RepID=UPI0030196C97
MTRLAELTDYKNKIINRMVGSEQLCKALFYTEPDFLNKPAVEDPSGLIYQGIYSYRFVPKIDQQPRTYITVTLKKFQPVKQTFKSGLIYFHVFTHTDLLPVAQGGTRVDYMLNQIDELFNQQRGIGIGKLEFYVMNDFVLNELYTGSYLVYKTVDFN